MAEFIGARISLFSKSNIRYIGTLHQIDSKTSTVALERVQSYGTEGRCLRPEDEVAPSDTVYDYIVFKGSDVKDLTILDPPKENEPPQMVPNDPAIVGGGSRVPLTQAQTRAQEPARPQGEQQSSQQQGQQQQFLPQMSMGGGWFYPPFPGQRVDAHNVPPLPPGAAFPGMPFGPPPGWYPPPGQGFPNQPQPFPNQSMPFVPPVLNQQPAQSNPKPAPIGQASTKEQKPAPPQLPQSSQRAPPRFTESAPRKSATPVSKAPTPPVQSKPDPVAALAPPAAIASKAAALLKPVSTDATPAATMTTTKSGSIVPAIPAVSNANGKGPSTTPVPSQPTLGNTSQQKKAQPSQAAANAALQSATEAATAAVAAAMAKLPPAPGSKQQQQQVNGSVDMLTRKVNELRTSGNGIAKPGRPEGVGSSPSHPRHRGRGGHAHGPHQARKIDVPDTDFDFASANAKFNKQELAEDVAAPAQSSVRSPGEDNADVNGTSQPTAESSSSKAAKKLIPPAEVPYNKAASFFDNISSEAKERADDKGPRPGGREWRDEEQKRNLQTFGQGSVDTGYRSGGYRGRGRGRGGYGGGGGGYRGGGGRGRGGSRGARGVGSHHNHHHHQHRSAPDGGQTTTTTVVVGSATTVSAAGGT